MSHEHQLILNLTVAITIALIGGLVAHRLKQSPIVGYLVTGMLIGPFTPGFVGNQQQIAVLAEIGVIFLMFALGIEFSLKELARIKGPAVIGTLVQLGLIILAGVAFGMLSGRSLMQSLFFGGIISVSSTMVILKNLMSRGEMESRHGRLLLAMLIVQDLAVVVLILLLPKLASSTDSATLDLAWVMLKALIFIGVTLFLGAQVVPQLMARVEGLRSPELFLLTAVALALCTASASAWLGLSPALGAFMGGLMLTETEFDHRVIAEMVPMRDLFATLFFVSVGMLIDVGFIVRHVPGVIGLALFIMLVKAAATAAALLPFRLGSKTTAFASLGMISIGEFNFVLAQVGRSSGVVSSELYNLILSSSLLTILLTPAAFWIAPRAGKAVSRFPVVGDWLTPRVDLEFDEATLENHAIIIGYGRVGKRMARGLRQAGLTTIIIDQNLPLVQEVIAKGGAAIYGDASYETVLAAARPQAARVIVVALPDFGATRAVVHRARHANPDVLIVARAQRAENDVKLREAGATAVVVPEMAGALMLLEETLLLLGLPHEHIFTGFSALQPTPQPELQTESKQDEQAEEFGKS